jgi:hypothetical protein
MRERQTAYVTQGHKREIYEREKKLFVFLTNFYYRGFTSQSLKIDERNAFVGCQRFTDMED